MGGRRVRIMVGVIVTVLALGTGTAMAAKIFYAATNGKASLGFVLNTSKGKIVDFSFEGLKCSDAGRLSGGLPDAVKVKSDRSFKTEQSIVTNEGVSIVVKFKGTVARDNSEVRGKLNFSGDCRSKGSFTAVPPAG